MQFKPIITIILYLVKLVKEKPQCSVKSSPEEVKSKFYLIEMLKAKYYWVSMKNVLNYVNDV